MIKHSKLVYIMGSIIIGIIAMLGIIAGLIFSGVWDASPRNLVFTSASETRYYNGEELVNHTWKLESGELKNGHVVEAVVTGSQTDAGQCENTFVIFIKDRNGADVTDDYSIVCNPGLLKVEKQPLVVTTKDVSKDYDGEELKNQESHVSISDGIVETQKAIITPDDNSITDPGTITNMATIKVVDIEDENVDRTHNYDITYEYGNLTVNKMEILIVTGTTAKRYNGEPQKYEKITYTKNFLNGHDIDPASIVFTCEYTDVGSYTNSIDDKLIKIVDQNGEDVTSFYSVKTQYGKLTIYHIDIEIRTFDASKAYDGTALTKDGYVWSGELVDGHEILVTVTGSRTVPGSSPNTFVIRNVVDKQGNSVSHNYKFTKVNGTLVVTGTIANPTPNFPSNPGDIDTEGSGTTSKVPVYQVLSGYSGNVYLKQASFGDYIVNGDQTSWGEDYVYTGVSYDPLQLSYYSQTASSMSVVVKKLLDEAPYVVPYYSNYNNIINDADTSYTFQFVPFDGDSYTKDLLKGTAYEWTEKAYRSFVYQNYLQLPSTTMTAMQSVIVNYSLDSSNKNIILKVADLVQNYVNYNTAFSIKGDTAIEFFNGADAAICQHYAAAATALFRALGIPARYVVGYMGEIIANRESIISTPGHAWVEVYIDGSGWMPVEVTGSGDTLPDESGEDDEIDVATKYYIKPYDIYLEGDMSSVISGYDRSELEGSEFNKFCKNNGYTYTFTVEGYQQGIGICMSKITSFNLFEKDGTDITEEYSYNFQQGKMHVYVQEIIVKTKGFVKYYDGKDHYMEVSDENYTIDYGKWDGLIDGHVVANIDFGAKIRNVGTVANSIRSFSIADTSGRDVTYFYRVIYQYGNLVIKPREIIITAGSKSIPLSELNGALTCDEYIIEKYSNDMDGDPLAEGHEINVYIVGSLSSLGRVSNIISSVTITDALGRDVLKNYTIHAVDGKLSIYKD